MTDERFEEIRAFIERWAVPPSPPLLPDGVGVPVKVVAGYGVAEIVDEPPCRELRVSSDEFADLRRRTARAAPDPVWPPAFTEQPEPWKPIR